MLFVTAQLGWTGTVRFFCQDESRFGLKTLTGRRITARDVKPVGKVHWTFKATYLYGVVEPATGAHFFYEFTHCNTDCFECFLKLVAQEYADSIVIIQVDQAGWHKAKRLTVPDNLILMFNRLIRLSAIRLNKSGNTSKDDCVGHNPRP